MRTIITILALPLAFGLLGCDEGADPVQPTVERSFEQGIVRAEVDDEGEVVAEVVDHDGTALATMDFSLSRAEGVLVVESSGDVHELHFDPNAAIEVDSVCETAYRLTTGDFTDPGDTQFRVQQFGCDALDGPGCCFVGVGGGFCEVCWGSGGYYDTYCGPAVY